VKRDAASQSVTQLRFVGDETTLIVEQTKVWIGTPKDLQEAGSEYHETMLTAAKYVDLDPASFAVVDDRERGRTIDVSCRNAKECSITHIASAEDCSTSRSDNSKQCEKTDVSLAAQSGMNIFDICPAQFANITLALNTLRSAALKAPRGNYVIRSDIDHDIAIREQPSKSGKIIGGIGSQASAVNLTDCGGGWCQIKWGEFAGYVQRVDFNEVRR
jgi:hypothetical protein